MLVHPRSFFHILRAFQEELETPIYNNSGSFTAENMVIIGNSTTSAKVTGVSVTAAGHWTWVPYTYNMAAAKADSMLIRFSLNGAAAKQASSSENLTLSGDWTIAKGTSLQITYYEVVPATSTAMQNKQVLPLVCILD